eukprot:Phypoly_transcript_11749.p1 GENE.Phypoly_transcript_11749~~Phypoly_transcript_11749.p1  ORF type:complete len:103 (-),score=13.27 Phypoly_transcript_11749:822-1130(-)
MKSIHLVLLFLCFSYASAHFVLSSPSLRGFEEAYEPTAPCGDLILHLVFFRCSMNQSQPMTQQVLLSINVLMSNLPKPPAQPPPLVSFSIFFVLFGVLIFVA